MEDTDGKYKQENIKNSGEERMKEGKNKIFRKETMEDKKNSITENTKEVSTETIESKVKTSLKIVKNKKDKIAE